MFDGQSLSRDLELIYSELEPDAPNIQSIIQQCSELPDPIRSAEVDKSFDRMLDDNELDRVTNPMSVEDGDTAAMDRLIRRRKELRPFLGSYLTSAIIRVPGLCYTIEVDMDSETVVHWECHCHGT